MADHKPNKCAQTWREGTGDNYPNCHVKDASASTKRVRSGLLEIPNFPNHRSWDHIISSVLYTNGFPKTSLVDVFMQLWSTMNGFTSGIYIEIQNLYTEPPKPTPNEVNLTDENHDRTVTAVEFAHMKLDRRFCVFAFWFLTEKQVSGGWKLVSFPFVCFGLAIFCYVFRNVHVSLLRFR